eukprot:Polyplicarium_translucidae@DN1988_c0_g2_i2.p1
MQSTTRLLCYKCKTRRASVSSRETSCDICFIASAFDNFKKCFRKDCGVERGDRIALALGGGQHGYAMLDMTMRYSTQQRAGGVEVACVVHIDESGPRGVRANEEECGGRLELLRASTATHGIPLVTVDPIAPPVRAEAAAALRGLEREEPASAAYVRGRLRERAVFRALRRRGIYKVLEARSADGAAASALGLLGDGSAAGSVGRSLAREERTILGEHFEILRPMIGLWAKEVTLYHRLRGLPAGCPTPRPGTHLTRRLVDRMVSQRPMSALTAVRTLRRLEDPAGRCERCDLCGSAAVDPDGGGGPRNCPPCTRHFEGTSEGVRLLEAVRDGEALHSIDGDSTTEGESSQSG